MRSALKAPRVWPWGPGPGGLGRSSYCPSPLQLAPGVNSGQGLGIEIIGTLQLVLCVLATTDRRRRDLGGSAPLAIGLSVALGHLLAVSGGPSQVAVEVGRAEPGCCGVLSGQWVGLRRGSCCGVGGPPTWERKVQGPPDHLSGSECHLSVSSPVLSLHVTLSLPLPLSLFLYLLPCCPCPFPLTDRLHRLQY